MSDDAQVSPVDALRDLEERQDALLEALDELEKRTEQVLRQNQPAGSAADGAVLEMPPSGRQPPDNWNSARAA